MKAWKKAGVNISAVFLGGAVAVGSTVPALAAESSAPSGTGESNVSDGSGGTNVASRSSAGQSQAEAASQVTKDETVYVKLNPDGSVKDITVSDWLKNTNGTAALEDRSDLTDITNVKGDEAYAAMEDGSLVWSSSGSDIYYQGKSSKELPVSIKITYELDGREISPQELAGKSGKVKIRYEYTNHSTQTVTINGEETTIATPFAVVTGMILPEEKFSNVEISSGKVISDGSKMIVAGMAMPGLKDSLGLTESELGDRLELPEAVEVTADVTDFSLDMTATIVTGSIFEDLGVEDISSVDDLENALDELSEAASALVDGSGELFDGVAALKEASGELGSGVSALKDGADTLKAGSETLAEGISAYTAGVDTLNDGIGAYTAGADALAQGTFDYTAGAAQLAGGIHQLEARTAGLPLAVHQLYEGAAAAQSGAGILADEATANALVSGNAQITEGISQLHDAITAIEKSLSASQGDGTATASSIELAMQTLAMVRANDCTVLQTLENARGVQTQVDQVKGLASENLQDTINSLEMQYSAQLEQSIAMLSANIDMIDALMESLGDFSADGDMEALMGALAQMEAATDPENAESLYAGSVALGEGIAQMNDGCQSLKTGIDALTAGLESLDSAASALPEGIGQLAAGADALTANNGLLTAGAGQLLNASAPLNQGAAALSDKSTELNDGALRLFEGASAIAGGTGTLNDSVPVMADGIDALYEGARELSEGMETFNEEGIGLVDRMQAVVDAGKAYETFTDLADGARGSVKFIIETEGISAEE